MSLNRHEISASSSQYRSMAANATHRHVLEASEVTASDDGSKIETYQQGSSKTFLTKTESGKKLRVTFRESRADSDDSVTSQNTVIENPIAAQPTPSKSTPSLVANEPNSDSLFEKLKADLIKETTRAVGELAAVAAAGGPPRVTVLRRGSITPTLSLTRTASSSTMEVPIVAGSIAGPSQTPIVKTVSFASSVTGGEASREVKVAVQHKRQLSLNGTESTSSQHREQVFEATIKPTQSILRSQSPALVQSTSVPTPISAMPPPPPPPPPPPQPQPVQVQAVVSAPPVISAPVPAPTPQPSRGSLPDLEAMPSIMRQLIAHFMACTNDGQQADLAGKMAAILEQAWNRGGSRGVEIAESMCKDIRQEGALSLAFTLASSNTTNLRDLRLNTFRLLVSSFSSENRFWIISQIKEANKAQPAGAKAKQQASIGDLNQLFGYAAATLRSAASASEFDAELCLAGFGIVRSLLAHSSETCCTALDSGVMEAISQGLRVLPSVITSAPSTELNQIQSTLSASIATMATILQSASHHQQVVNQANAVDRFLLPICNADENPVAQYFALLSAVSFYQFDGSDDDAVVASAAARSGADHRALRDSMAAFLQKPGNSPSTFPFAACSLLVRRGPMSIADVKPDQWLRRFVDIAVASGPGRVGFAPEIQGMALFHISVELERILGTGLVDDFVRSSSSFIQPLLKIAESPNPLANRLASALLHKVGHLYQKPIAFQRLSNQVPQWSTSDVKRWLENCVGLKLLDDEARSAVEYLDGDLLLAMPIAELRQALFHHSNKAKIALFERHLTHLKMLADYSSFDSSDIEGFLQRIDFKLRQYTYTFLHAGIDRHFAVRGDLDEHILSSDCGISNGVHRQQILTAAKCMTPLVEPYEDSKHKTSNNSSRKASNLHNKWLYDVFICYKRSSGSQLASLLKVYLETRGYRVFLDVTDLSSGKCYERLVETIYASRNFLLVLTGGSLDGLLGDEDRSDWIHREIYAAFRAKCNIIPVADNYFTWPTAINSLPADVRAVCSLNTIKWLHEYQEACVDKIEKFIIDNINETLSAKLAENADEPQPRRDSPMLGQKEHSGEAGGMSSVRKTTSSAKRPVSPRTNSISSTAPADYNSSHHHGGPHNPPNPTRSQHHHLNKTN